MSLDFNLTNIKDREVHFPPNTEHVEMLGSMNRKIHAIVWATIVTRIGVITDEAEAVEFYRRYVVWHRLNTWPDAELPFTVDDVKHAVGLSTNVFPRTTRKQWAKQTLGDDYTLERLVPLD